MGWNDHVSMVEMQCQKCGEVDTWECWDEVAKNRYGGTLGLKLGHDITDADRCPHCGSTDGKPYDEDEDDRLDRELQELLDRDNS